MLELTELIKNGKKKKKYYKGFGKITIFRVACDYLGSISFTPYSVFIQPTVSALKMC